MTRLPLHLFGATVALATLTVSAEVLAAPPGWTDYTVVSGDSCASVALKAYGDATRYDLIHEGNPDLGPSPHHLKPGSILHLPPKPTAAPDAHLTSVRNVVQVNASRGKPNDPLFRGNRVATEAAAAADIEFRDTTALELGENTLVVIFGDSATKATKSRTAADATLVSGRLRGRLGELAGRNPADEVLIRTEAGVAHVTGGEIQVHVDEKKATRLAVYQGHSTLTAQNHTVNVDKGFGSKALEGKAPLPPRPLPPAPLWSTPFPPLVLANGDVPVDAAGSYAAGTGPGDAPAEWHVELARDATFHDVVVDTRVPVAVVRLEGKQIKAGNYFARVSAIDADKFEGPFGPIAHVVVATVDVKHAAHHTALLDVAPHGFLCAVTDGQPLTATTTPLLADLHEAAKLRCAITADAVVVATLDVPADMLGPLTVKTRWRSEDATRREGDVVVDILDAETASVPRPAATITSASPGVRVVSVTRESDSGAYLVHVAWDAQATTAALQVVLSPRDEAVSSSLAIPLAKVVDPIRHWEIGLGGGIALTKPISYEAAPRVELGLDWKTPAGPGWLRFGGGLSVESAPATAASGASANGTAAIPSTFTPGVFLDVAYRFRRGDPRLAPYLLVAPQVLAQSSGSPSTGGGSESHTTMLGVAGLVGLDLRAGPGAFYLEGGYRWTDALHQEATTISTRGGVFTLGYRLEL